MRGIMEAYWEAGGVSSPPAWLENTAIIDMEKFY